MSDHNHDASDNLIVGLVGKLFYLLVPIILIVMMGIVGAAFIGGAGHRKDYSDLERVADPNPPNPDPNKLVKPIEEPVSDERIKELVALGQKNWANCFACHGDKGQGGAANMAPPLVGSKILLGNPEAALAAVHKGIVKGPESKWLGVMVGLAHLDDEKVAGILTYARKSFGNNSTAITPEMSAAVRSKYADKVDQFTREELEEISVQ